MRGIVSGVSDYYYLLYVLVAMFATTYVDYIMFAIKYVHNIMFATILLFSIV